MKIDTKDIIALKPEISSLDFIDSGGFKIVYKGVVNGSIEAIKLITLESAQTDEEKEELISRIQREIKILDLCKSEIIVKLASLALESVKIQNIEYLIYSEEFIDGETLSSRISKAYKPDFDELKILATNLFEAIKSIESVNYIHRDIKPKNLIATNKTERPFVLLDFGIAYHIQGTNLTRQGNPPGTLLYMAPELLKPDYKDYLDIRSDIYSAGVTLYEYASGVNPFRKTGENPYTTIYRILKQNPDKLIKHRPDLPEAYCDIIDRCIKKLPALRHANPDIVLKELEALK